MDTLEKEFDTPIDTDETEVELPLLPVRDTVVFPRMLTPLFVGRDRSVLALEAALVEKSQLVVVTQRDADLEDPKPEDLYSIGTEVVIGRMLRMPDGSTNILAQGHQRVKIIEYTQENPYLRVRVRRLSEENEKNLNSEVKRFNHGSPADVISAMKQAKSTIKIQQFLLRADQRKVLTDFHKK